eukprot:8296275-Alexandrium_andersonii.AAC.1
MQLCFRRLELDLHGPNNGLKGVPRSSRLGALCAIIRSCSEPGNDSGDRWGSEAAKSRSGTLQPASRHSAIRG